jgi:hypothetical protein
MKKRILNIAVGASLALASATSSNCFAGDSWTTREKVLEGTYLGLVLVDWGQTLYIADHPDEYFEHNKILGQHPSRGEVNTYFTTLMVTHIVIADVLNHKWREPFQWVSIILAIRTVNHNHSIGIQIDF